MRPMELNDDQKVAKLRRKQPVWLNPEPLSPAIYTQKLPTLSGEPLPTIVTSVPTKQPFRVLFVCWGNICRSPAGQNVFQHLLDENGMSDRINCDSAGTIDAHAGKSPDGRMRDTLEQRGISVNGAARKISAGDFRDFDLILTMDDFNRQEVLAVAPDAEARAKVHPFTDFCENHEADEVPDPYYGGSSGFELVADLIEDGCQGLLAHIQRQIS